MNRSSSQHGNTVVFAVVGAMLLATSIAGYVWTAVINPLHSESVVALGDGGLVAVSLAWASRAATWQRATLRWMLAEVVAVALWIASLIVILSNFGGSIDIFGQHLTVASDGILALHPRHDGDPWIVYIEPRATSGLMGAFTVVVVPLWGALAWLANSSKRKGVWSAALTITATAPVWHGGLREVRARHELAAIIATASLGWLLWAFHRTRRAHADGGHQDPSPALSAVTVVE